MKRILCSPVLIFILTACCLNINNVLESGMSSASSSKCWTGCCAADCGECAEYHSDAVLGEVHVECGLSLLCVGIFQTSWPHAAGV